MEKCEDEKVIAELTDAKTQLEAELAEAKTKHEAEVKELKAKAEELTQAKAKVDAELKDVKAKQDKTKAAAPPDEAVVTLQAEMKAVKAENETLKAWKLAQEDADHMHRVQDVVDLQASNGLLETKKVQAAVESLKKLPNEALDAMKAQLEGVKGKFDSLPSGPKARLIPGVVAARFDPMQPTVGDRVGKKPGEL